MGLEVKSTSIPGDDSWEVFYSAVVVDVMHEGVFELVTDIVAFEVDFTIADENDIGCGRYICWLVSHDNNVHRYIF